MLFNKDSKKKINHAAITMQGSLFYAKKNNLSAEEVLKKRFDCVKDVIRANVKLNIPMLSFHVLSDHMGDNNNYSVIVDNIAQFFSELSSWDFLDSHKIKVSVLGKWYDLPGRAVDEIKKVIDETRDYDSFFVNFCINYDGQEEIVDAAKLIARQIKAEKIDIDDINKSLIKDNLYSSFLLPPDVIMKTGNNKKVEGFLLWDNPNSIIYFANICWPEFTKDTFLKGIEYFEKC